MNEAEKLLTILREQIRAVRSDPSAGTIQRAQTIAKLVDSGLRVIQVATLEERLEAVERVLKARKGEKGK